MCWSKHEREEWLRLQREWEEERRVASSATEPEEEPETREAEVEREGELVRV